MHYKTIQEKVYGQPFEPIRLKLTNGSTYEVRHPEMMIVTRRSVAVAVYPDGSDEAEYATFIATEHIVEIEPLSAGKQQT